MFTEYTESEVVEKAEEYTEYSLSELITPKDLDKTAENWSDVDDETLEKELWKSSRIILNEASAYNSELYGLLHDYTIQLYREDLARINKEIVKDGITTKELVIDKGFWPNKMDKWTVHEIIEANSDDIHDGYKQDAYNVVIKGVRTKLNPEE